MRVTEQSPFRGPDAQRLADQKPSKAQPRGLPVSPRERKPALAALAVLLIIGGAMLTVTLVLRSGDRVSAIEITQRVGAGQPIPMSALREVQVPEDGPAFVYWSAARNMTSYYAAVDLVPGTLLNKNMIAGASAELVPGKAVVGLSLKSGQVPPKLEAGQRVQVIYVPSEDGDGQPKVLSRSALVDSVGGAQRGTGTGNLLVSVVVDDNVSPQIAAYASVGRIALTYLPGVSHESPEAPPVDQPTTRKPADSQVRAKPSPNPSPKPSPSQSNLLPPNEG